MTNCVTPCRFESGEGFEGKVICSGLFGGQRSFFFFRFGRRGFSFTRSFASRSLCLRLRGSNFRPLLKDFRADQFEDGRFGAVSDSKSGTHDARITARTGGIALSQVVEESLDSLGGCQITGRQTARMQVTALSECDEPLRGSPGSLCLGYGGFNALLEHEGGNKITEQGTTMRRIPSKLFAKYPVPHK